MSRAVEFLKAEKSISVVSIDRVCGPDGNAYTGGDLFAQCFLTGPGQLRSFDTACSWGKTSDDELVRHREPSFIAQRVRLAPKIIVWKNRPFKIAPLVTSLRL